MITHNHDDGDPADGVAEAADERLAAAVHLDNDHGTPPWRRRRVLLVVVIAIVIGAMVAAGIVASFRSVGLRSVDDAGEVSSSRSMLRATSDRC